MENSSLLYLILHSADYLLEFAVAFLFLSTSRKQPDRARLFMGLFMLVSISISALNIFYVVNTTTEKGDEMIAMISCIFSFPVFFLLLLYLVECLFPNEYDCWKILKLLSPWLCIAIPTVAVCRIYGETPLYTIWDVIDNIRKPDVILRIISLLIYLPYGFWCMILPSRVNNGMMSRPLTGIMCWCTAAMCVTYVGGHGLTNPMFDVMHVIFYFLITLMAVYSEFADRLQPEVETKAEPQKREVATPSMESQIAQRLQKLMTEEQLWRNPDLMQVDVVRALGSNTKYVQNAIRELGYESYPEMINFYRVDFVKNELDRDPDQNLKTLFYNAGFRSRITAWRCFTKVVGCSPKDYHAG